MTLPFMKMHGLGNDFVVLDARTRAVNVTPALAQALADRHRGVGFDQLAVITWDGTTPHLTFYNADGSTAGACGNATRCVARYLMDDTGETTLTLTTERGVLKATDAGFAPGDAIPGKPCRLTSVNMGPPQLSWDRIPLARAMETLKLPIDGGPPATGMGNPQCT